MCKENKALSMYSLCNLCSYSHMEEESAGNALLGDLNPDER